MKRLIIYSVLLLFLFPIANAEISRTKLTDYLNNNLNIESDSVETASYSLLFLKNFSEEAMDLFSRKGSSSCFPAESCTIKETALASILIAKDPRFDRTKYTDWLKTKQISLNQNTYVQVISTEAVNCTITYSDKSEEKFQVEDSYQKKVKSTATGKIKVSCDSASSISLLMRSISSLKETVQILEQIEASNAEFNLDNTCFGSSSCNIEDTAYASYALYLAGEPIKSLPYLKQNTGNNILANAIAYELTKDSTFSAKILALQKDDGNFNNNVRDTAMASFVLKTNTKALDWLTTKQSDDGSFGSKEDTGFVAYWIYAEKTKSQTTPASPSTPSGSSPYCGDKVCNNLENETTCPGDCSTSTFKCSLDRDCSINEICDLLSNTCLTKSDTETPSTPSIDTPECTTDDDCLEGKCIEEVCTLEEESSSLWWLWLIILLLALGGGAYFAYTKLYSKKDNISYKPQQFQYQPQQQKPVFNTGFENKPQQQKPASRRPMFEDAMERELDKSIEEAKKLAKK